MMMMMMVTSYDDDDSDFVGRRRSFSCLSEPTCDAMCECGAMHLL